MTELFNDCKAFGEQAVAGFSAAHSRYVQQVRGGVIRSTESPEGRVGLVLAFLMSAVGELLDRKP